MRFIESMLHQGKTNFLLIGRAGCGKSEVALNLALHLSAGSKKAVHFFDMDMTKPLFRSRDAFGGEIFKDITFHYEEQFYDAPTLVGGVREQMMNPEVLSVLDVGGDDTGARSIGGFMIGPARQHTVVLYVLNAYRPFCSDIEHIRRIQEEILAVSHIPPQEVFMVDNPNLGPDTTADEVAEGSKRMHDILSGEGELVFTCVREDLANDVKDRIATEIFPMRMFLTYPWLIS